MPAADKTNEEDWIFRGEICRICYRIVGEQEFIKILLLLLNSIIALPVIKTELNYRLIPVQV